MTPTPVAHLGELIRDLSARRNRLDELRDLVAGLSASQLVPIVGEQNLERELRQMLVDADGIIEEISHSAAGEVDGELLRLDALVHAPLWELERTVVERLRTTLLKVQDCIGSMNAKLLTLQTDVSESWRALDAARVYGVIDPEQQARTSAVESLVKQAQSDAALQRYGHVAQAMAQIDQIGKLSGSNDKLAERLAQAQDRVGKVVKHSELVLIRSEGQENVLEYTALLRIPRSDVQRVDLAASSVLVVRDRSALADIVHQVASIVDATVRSARGLAVAKTQHPGPRDESDAGQESGRTRRFADDAIDGLLPLKLQAGGVPDDVIDQLTDVGQRLYTLFLPDEMQRLLDEARGSLIVTTNDLELPWELLHDGADFLCLQRPMARMPLGRGLPRRPHLGRQNSDGRKLRILLVASDPYGDLPDARREVETVRDRLVKAYSEAVHIKCLIGADATGEALNDSLHSGGFHIIHYAGHASFDKERPERSRLLLHSDQKETPEPFFAQKIERLMEGTPLVFLNACESSAATNERPAGSAPYFAKETQGLASAFLYGGASACVGSLWPVFDNTAAELASTFYERLFEGLSAGEALRHAREAARASASDKVTWAAYALYGDPLFELPLHPRSTQDRANRLPAN